MDKEKEPVQISISFGDKESAISLGKRLVELRLIACAQIFPISSIYQWNDKIQSEEEYLIQAKTTRGNLSEIETYITKNHSYEVPEIIAVPIVWAHEPYLNWVQQNTR